MNRTLIIMTFFLFALPALGNSKKAEAILRKSKTNIVNPLDLRDPFKRPSLKTKKKQSKKVETTFFTNVPTIDSTPLENIRIVGILVGKERRAIAKVIGGDQNDNETFILKEGMTLGQNKAIIKAILPGGILLAEKITNVYDEEEYLETVIPVSNE